MGELTVEQLIAKLNDPSDKVRYDAWQAAGPLGAAAVKPAAKLMAEMDAEVARLLGEGNLEGEKKAAIEHKLEVGRAAKRALWVIVRYVGRPGAAGERNPVVAELCDLLGNEQPDALRREVLWMLSEIGGDEAVEAISNIAGILENAEIREDARCAVQRIPGEAALQALRGGFSAAPEELKFAIADSLRDRDVEVDGYASKKLVPTRQTSVKPVGRP